MERIVRSSFLCSANDIEEIDGVFQILTFALHGDGIIITGGE